MQLSYSFGGSPGIASSSGFRSTPGLESFFGFGLSSGFESTSGFAAFSLQIISSDRTSFLQILLQHIALLSHKPDEMHAVGDIVDVTVGDIVGGRYGGVIDGVEVGDDVEGGLDDGVIDEGEMVVTTIASGASDSPAAVTRTDDGDDVAIKSTVYDSKTAVSPISVDTNDPNKTDATTSGMKAITTRHILRLRPTAKSTSRMERDPVRSSPVLGSPSLS